MSRSSAVPAHHTVNFIWRGSLKSSGLWARCSQRREVSQVTSPLATEAQLPWREFLDSSWLLEPGGGVVLTADDDVSRGGDGQWWRSVEAGWSYPEPEAPIMPRTPPLADGKAESSMARVTLPFDP